MATRTYAISPGRDDENVVEFVGSACTSRFINLTIDFATTVMGDGGTTRAMRLSEVLQALENMKEFIMRRDTWPPA